VILRRRFERARQGYRLRLPRNERDVLRAVTADVRARLEDDPDDPDLERLFPPAYDEAAEEAEYRQLMYRELLDGRLEALAVVEATVDRDHLEPAEAEAWLRALNDARLVLGTRLGVTEDTLIRNLDPRDPRSRALALYGYLSWLQEEVVAALAGDVGARS
jgi:hypothetical protein